MIDFSKYKSKETKSTTIDFSKYKKPTVRTTKDDRAEEAKRLIGEIGGQRIKTPVSKQEAMMQNYQTAMKYMNLPIVQTMRETKADDRGAIQKFGDVSGKVLGTGAELGKAVLRAPGRFLVSAGIQPAADVLSLIKNKQIEAKYEPKTTFEKMIFGEEPIRGIFKNVEEAQKVSKELSEKLGLDPSTSQGMSLAIAPLFVGGMGALDLAPVGGTSKNAVKFLAKIDDTAEVGNLLRKMGATEDLIQIYAPKIAKTKSVKEIDEGLKSLDNALKNTIQRQATKPKYTPVAERQATKADPLIQEAKKYKSAEEFVKAQSLYHGTPNELEGGVLKFGAGKQLKKGGYMGGHFLTDTPEIAESFSFGGKVYQASGEIKNKVLDINKNKKLFQDYIGKEYLSDGEKVKFTQQEFDYMFPDGKADWATLNTDLAEQLAKKQGKIGVAIPEYAGGKQGTTYQIFEDNIPVKTKSQLTDIWNKAQKVEAPKKPLSGKEQLAQREEAKLQRMLDRQEREVAKIERESFKFYEEELENQYQNFKKIVSPKKVNEIEDATQLKSKLKAKPEEIDNILYSQEKNADEIFEMFKDRMLNENIPLPRLTKVPKETKAMVAEKARRTVMSEKEKVNRRRDFVKAVKAQFGLSDNDLRRISQKDIRNMKDLEFKTFLDDARWKAAELAETRQAKNELMTTIREGEFQKVDNLRRAMGLPPIDKMSMAQLRQYDEALSPFQRGDVFLTQRDLELVDRTKLKGVRTLREAREALAKEFGVPLEKLEQTKYDWADLVRYDTALAEKNPFYKVMVERSQESVLMSDARFLNVEKQSDKLAKLAEKSRQNLTLKERIWNKFAPQDESIVRYLEATPADKVSMAEKLTKEQLDYAHYMERYFSDAYDHLVEMKNLMGSRFEDIYYPHMRKNFFENVRDNGVLKAFKNLRRAEEQDKVVFSIIGEDTGEILSKEKFFSNVLYRTGELDPSLNVTKTFKRYVKAFEKKKALDEIIPEIEIYAQALTPTNLTPKGLEMDRRLKSFVKKYLNNKKGRKATYGGIVEQNGAIDMGLRAGNTFVALKDLGFNVYAGIAATVGEQVMTYQALGKIKYLKAWKRRMWDTGIKRLSHKNANKILTENKEFIGKDIWTELGEAGEGLSEKFTKGLFGFFSQSSVEANKLFLLGSITEAELKAGKLSAERLAKLRLEAGRWRDMGRDVKSILGSTSVGATATKYKGWAVPIMRTTVDDLIKVGSKLKKGKFKEALTGKEALELYRALEMSAVLMAVGGYVISEEKDESFIGKLKARAYMEAMTFLGGIDPTLFLATPRLYNFTQDFASNIKKIIQLEEYQQSGMWGEEGELKGVKGLQRLVTPNFLQGALRRETEPKRTKRESSSGSRIRGASSNNKSRIR